MNVEEFLSKNKQKYEIFTQYQHVLNYLYEKEQLEEIYEFVETNKEIFFKDRASGILCIGLMNLLSIYNYWHFELICDVWIHFKDRFYQLDIDDFDVLRICTFPYIWYYLYTHSALSIESIAQLSLSRSSLLFPFYSSLKKYDPEIIERSKKEKELDTKPFFQSIIENPEENDRNWSISYHPNPLHKYIRDDNLESFQTYLSMNKVGINDKIPHSHYERTLTVDRDPLLIQIAAVYGSINIFKFLWAQPNIHIPSNLMSYAYSGRNYEIIHLCESKCDYTEGFKFAITTLQDDLFEYYIENFKKKPDDDDIYQSLDASDLNAVLQSNNYAILIPCLKKIVSLIPTGSIELSSISTWDIPLTNFLYSYYTMDGRDLSYCLCNFDIHAFDCILDSMPEYSALALFEVSVPYSTPKFLIQFIDRCKKIFQKYPREFLYLSLFCYNEMLLIKSIEVLKEINIKIDFKAIYSLFLQNNCVIILSKKCIESFLKKTERLLDPDEKSSFISTFYK